MAGGGGDDAGVGDGLELSLRLGTPTLPPAPAPRNGLTTVYDRRCALCALDAVELQAIAIISMAKNITDDGGGIAHLDQRCSKVVPTWRAGHASTPAYPDVAAPSSLLLGDQAGLSMKRSLQRFLEKRKARAASPYAVHLPARPPRS